MSVFKTMQYAPLLSDKTRSNLAYSMQDDYPREGQFKSLPILPPSRKKRPSATKRPKMTTFTEQRLWALNPDDHTYRTQWLNPLPAFLSRYFGGRYEKKLLHQGRAAANTFLRQTLGGAHGQRLQLVESRYLPQSDQPNFLFIQFHHALHQLTDFDTTQQQQLANDIARYLSHWLLDYIDTAAQDNRKNRGAATHKITPSLELQIYQICWAMLTPLGITMPYHQQYQNQTISDEALLITFAKITDETWWKRQLKKIRDSRREHLAIAAGQVHKKAAAYCSLDCQREWLNQKKANLRYLQSKNLRDEETGEEIPLLAQVQKSHTNPTIRRYELMVRIRGFEELAEQMQFAGEFYTLTAPAKYHNTHRTGAPISNWAGYSPKETQAYLCQVWARIRAKLKRENITVFGFRVAEPHHDGTPHWHLLLFMHPAHVQQVRQIFRHYALKEDGHEPGAQQHRFNYTAIDKQRGSATGYIAKYIAKNIDGYALEGQLDDETGQDLSSLSTAVTAWASRWRIRQFQQIGGAPVSIWRELRRLRHQSIDDPHIASAFAAADRGDWAAYTQIQGGVTHRRQHALIRLTYKNHTNQYGETMKKIQGIYSTVMASSQPIITRTKKWLIVTAAAIKQQTPTKINLLPSWSSVSNYTQKEIRISKTDKVNYDKQNIFQFLKYDERQFFIPIIFNEI